MINRSLVGKVWLAMVVLVIAVMFFLGLFLSQYFEEFYFALRAQELAKHGEKLAEMVVSVPSIQEWQQEISLISRYIDAQILVIDRWGLIQAYTAEGLYPGQKLNYPEIEKLLAGQIVRQRGVYPGLDVTVISVGVPIIYRQEVVGAVLLNAPVEPITKTVNTVRKSILYGALGTVLLSTVLAFILSKRITRPILDMNRVAMEMAKGNFGERVAHSSEDEIGLLGKTLNYLSSELQDNIEALSNEKEQLENILTSMSDAVITFDDKGNVLLMNPPAREMLKSGAGPRPGHIGGLPFGPELKQQFDDALREKTHIKSKARLNDRVYQTGMTPLRSNGEVRGVVAVLHDITKEDRLDKLRKEFVANVSHELRSPLSLLQGYVEALIDGLAEDDEARDKYLQILLDETLRLRRLVNDLLDLTQLETGNMAMKFEELSLAELVNRVTGRMRPMFAEQGKDLLVDIPDSLPPVWGDEDRLQQVLVNLLDNALKFTPTGGAVRVSAEAGPDWVWVSVADSGPGIPESELENIWERFYKVDKARTREGAGGTGLGLSIVKNIVLAHGGEVGVASMPGRGTTFKFSVRTAQKK